MRWLIQGGRLGVLADRTLTGRNLLASRNNMRFASSTVNGGPLTGVSGADGPESEAPEHDNDEKLHDSEDGLGLEKPNRRYDPYPIVYPEGSSDQTSAYKLFSKLGLSTSLITYMSQRFERPTPIQEAAIPSLLKGHSAMLASQTGSGKTLAYMLPLIVRMQAAEQRRLEQPELKHKNGPRVLILSPTRELSAQLINQAKSLSHAAKFRARAWGNERIKRKYDGNVPPDVVVTSPSAFDREMRWSGWSVESIVFDECDVLLNPDSGFLRDIAKILKRVKVDDVQIVCVGATALKSEAKKWMQRIRPDAEIIKAEGAGDLPKNIKVHMVSVRDDEGYNKHPALERALGPFLSFPVRDPNDNFHPRCIVFCNSVASCRSTAHTLEEKYSDVADVYCLHGEMKPKQRSESFNGFLRESDLKPKKPKVLVCTDLTSRGIDVKNVQHVVIFDIPNNVLDFLHRAGRTGRAGNQGEVTFIVGRGEKQKLLDVLETGSYQPPADRNKKQ